MVFPSMVDLDAKHYRKHSSLQYEVGLELLNTLDLKGSETVFDIGCGDGRTTVELAKRVPQGSVLGIDPSAAMIDLATSSFQKERGLTFQKASAEEFFFEEKADLILMINVLHWVRDPKKALQNISNHLKEGGQLIILTYPKESSYLAFLEKTLNEERWLPYQELSASQTILSAQEYRKLLENFQLTIETYTLEEKIASYKDSEELENYVRGWFNCFLPLPQVEENLFLKSAIENASKEYLKKEGVHIPYSRLVIKARN
ncbi:MAG: Trans-aconitate 2-methyltransferase [Chlamydiales bacterium]|nr:Trans-aconitate 2-methyltransferase [Chlamydiales bacterium]MCH9620335.1 Trans-aconitate 2-methyltransferase [Chlamydiales bacterium]MCH9622321.1 Trans-aconitate 2-methyltransferase [Chlamydiales bacterium]